MRDEIINLFKKGIFLYKGNIYKTNEKEESDEKLNEELDENKFFKDIENESKGINFELFEKHFNSVSPTALAKELFETKDEKKNNGSVKLIMFKWSILKDEVEKRVKTKRKLKNQKKILDTIKRIITFNERI